MCGTNASGEHQVATYWDVISIFNRLIRHAISEIICGWQNSTSGSEYDLQTGGQLRSAIFSKIAQLVNLTHVNGMRGNQQELQFLCSGLYALVPNNH